MNIAGVDLLEGANGPLVLEVNSSPGLEGIEKASGVNVAGAIIDYVTSEAVFSEVDLDQLLRTVPGSGVISIQLTNHPSMVGKEISDLFVYGDNVQLIGLSRDSNVIWNPKLDTQLRYDDVVICYGELNQLRKSLKKAILQSDERSVPSTS